MHRALVPRNGPSPDALSRSSSDLEGTLTPAGSKRLRRSPAATSTVDREADAARSKYFCKPEHLSLGAAQDCSRLGCCQSNSPSRRVSSSRQQRKAVSISPRRPKQRSSKPVLKRSRAVTCCARTLSPMKSTARCRSLPRLSGLCSKIGYGASTEKLEDRSTTGQARYGSWRHPRSFGHFQSTPVLSRHGHSATASPDSDSDSDFDDEVTEDSLWVRRMQETNIFPALSLS